MCRCLKFRVKGWSEFQNQVKEFQGAPEIWIKYIVNLCQVEYTGSYDGKTDGK